MSEQHNGPIVDVDLIVSEIRQRAAARRDGSEYDRSLLETPFELIGGASEGRIVLRPSTAFSSKRFLGRPITVAKKILVKALFHFLNDAVQQANAALAQAYAALEAESRSREALEVEVASLSATLEQALRRITALERRAEPNGTTSHSHV
jgi:hypothetical protein